MVTMKKMVLMDPTHLLLKTSPVPDTLSDSVLSLDDEIKRVLESTSLSDHDKALNYEQVLDKYLRRVNHVNSRQTQRLTQMNTTTRLPQEESLKPHEKTIKLEKRLVDSLPKTLQRKGEVLLDHIKDTTEMSWNNRGELIVNGATIAGTNVTDLIHELLRSRKLGNAPKGWSTFASTLRESNIPVDLIGNKARWESPDEPELKMFSPMTPSTPVKMSGKKGKRNKKAQNLDWSPY